MECRESGFVLISCIVDECPVPRFRVILADLDGKELCELYTDQKGYACLRVNQSGEYRLRVLACGSCNPRGQNRWVHLTAETEAYHSFRFQGLHRNKLCGAVAVTLRDQTYPEYQLAKGVFTLWRLSK